MNSSHVIRHYFTMGDVGNDPSLCGDESLMTNTLEGGIKHPYFLRAKTARHHPVSGEDEEFKNLSSSFEEGIKSNKKRASPLLSPPTLSRGPKSDNFEEYSASTEEEDLANCLVMLSSKSYPLSGDHKEENKGKQVVEKGVFQCKACKKIFNSHQALGGHRASHKKVKGCFAAKLGAEENLGDDFIQEENEHMTTSGTDPTRTASTTSARKKTKMHECSVCHRVFSSGQALGGHKRCHWLTTSTDNAFMTSFQDFQYEHQLCQKPMFAIPPHDKDHHQLDLNLNLPAPQNENHADDSTNTLEASTRFLLQKKLGTSSHNKHTAPSTANDNCQKGCEMNKLRKLSDLRDVNYGGSGWLQMGTASTAI